MNWYPNVDNVQPIGRWPRILLWLTTRTCPLVNKTSHTNKEILHKNMTAKENIPDVNNVDRIINFKKLLYCSIVQLCPHPPLYVNYRKLKLPVIKIQSRKFHTKTMTSSSSTTFCFFLIFSGIFWLAEMADKWNSKTSGGSNDGIFGLKRTRH